MGHDYYIDGPIHQSDLLKPRIPQKEEPLPLQFFRSAVYAGVQAPISGVVQLADKVVGSNILPKVQFIDPCRKAEFGTLSWHTQQFGAMVGVSAGILALNKSVGGTSNYFLGKIENSVEKQGALALRSVLDAAATGFIHNGLFRPVSDEEGNFYAARLKNAVVGAGTYATLSATTLGIKTLGQGRQDMLGSIMRNNIGSTVLAGIPGGIAYAEMKSLADGNGHADLRTMGQAVYSFSVLGGAFAAGKQLIGGTKAEDALQQQMKDGATAAMKRLGVGSSP